MQRGWVGSFLAQAEGGGKEGQEQAQQQQQQQKQPGGQGGGPQPCGPQMLIPLGIIVILFYFMMIKPQRKQEHQRRELLANLKKNDRVVTIGGIYGVVTNVNATRDEVTIRVDDDTNTKLRLTRSSIQRVISPDAPESDKG